jgi:hypothetical protein
MKRGVKFANIVLIGAMILCAALFLYALSDNFLPKNSVYSFYFISITMFILLLFVFFRCKDEMKINISLILLISAAGIYIIEIILALMSLAPMKTIHKTAPAGNGAPTVDTRTKFDILMDMRKKGIDAYPHVMLVNYIGTDGLAYKGAKIFPLGAISNRTTLFCKEGSDAVIYETDEHGFRNPRGQYGASMPDVVLIGDSLAQGYCVKDGEDIAGRLRNDNKKVLNLGIEAIGPLIYLGILSEYAIPFHPKNVFWLHAEGNDLPDLSGEKMSPTLMKYVDKGFSQDLVNNQDLADSALIADMEKKIAAERHSPAERKDIKVEKRRSYITSFKKILPQILKLDRLRSKLGFHENCRFEMDPLFEDILKEAKNRVEAGGGRFYLIYMPAYDRYVYKKDMCVRRKFNLQREKVTALATSLNIKMIDMTGYFDSQSDPLSLFNGHYNANAYRLIAQEIENVLK